MCAASNWHLLTPIWTTSTPSTTLTTRNEPYLTPHLLAKPHLLGDGVTGAGPTGGWDVAITPHLLCSLKVQPRRGVRWEPHHLVFAGSPHRRGDRYAGE